MQVQFSEPTGRKEYRLESHLPEPTIMVDSAELGAAGQGHLRGLVRVTVEGPDGRFARVWVSARRNALGQVQFELATNKANHTTRARVTAHWRL